MSTRRATFTSYAPTSCCDEVGADVFRFFMVERKAEGHLDFGVDLAKDRTGRSVRTACMRMRGRAASSGRRRQVARAARLVRAFPLALAEGWSCASCSPRWWRGREARAPHRVAYYLRALQA